MPCSCYPKALAIQSRAATRLRTQTYFQLSVVRKYVCVRRLCGYRRAKKCDRGSSNRLLIIFSTSVLKSMVFLGPQQVDLFTSRTTFCSKLHFFPCHWEWNTKTKLPIRFKRFFKLTNRIVGKWKAKKPLLLSKFWYLSKSYSFCTFAI